MIKPAVIRCTGTRPVVINPLSAPFVFASLLFIPPVVRLPFLLASLWSAMTKPDD